MEVDALEDVWIKNECAADLRFKEMLAYESDYEFVLSQGEEHYVIKTDKTDDLYQQCKLREFVWCGD